MWQRKRSTIAFRNWVKAAKIISICIFEKTIITQFHIIMKLSIRQLNLQMPSIPFDLIFYSGCFARNNKTIPLRFSPFLRTRTREEKKITTNFSQCIQTNRILRFIAHFLSHCRAVCSLSLSLVARFVHFDWKSVSLHFHMLIFVFHMKLKKKSFFLSAMRQKSSIRIILFG